jgi:hypothetical protein
MLLPLGFISSLWVVFKKTKNDYILFSGLAVLFYFLMNLTIDFWPRYLIPIIPLLVISFVFITQKRLSLIVIVLFSYLPFLYSNYFPGSSETSTTFQTLYQKNFYKDSYQYLDSQTSERISVDDWKVFNLENDYRPELFKLVKQHNRWRVSAEIR